MFDPLARPAHEALASNFGADEVEANAPCAACWSQPNIGTMTTTPTGRVPIMTELTFERPTTETPRAGRVDAVNVSQHVGARQILQELSLSIEPGELVAIAGGSGAGKSTLLEILAGLQPPSAGKVRHDGFARGARAAADSRIGYVPQDDIIHLEMPLRRTLRYAARLRLPAGTTGAEADRVVEETMGDRDLADRADVPVRALSGGQRKRASIAVELLTRPRLFFLDEPTSGLDPSTAAEVIGVLRHLSDAGVTVVLTTHNPADIEACDRVVFLARDGYLAFAGTPAEAKVYFHVDRLAQIYRLLANRSAPPTWDGPVPELAPAAMAA